MATELTAERLAELRARIDNANRKGLTFLSLRVLTVDDLLRAAEERDELRARLRHDCKGCPGCGSNDCPDALDAAQHERDRLRAQRDALVAAADRVVRRSREIEWTEPNEGGLRQRAMESTVEDIVALREAVSAAKENQ